MTSAKPTISAEILSFPNREEVLRSVLEHASIGMTLVDTNGSVVYANPAFAEMFRYPLADCIGLRVPNLVETDMVASAEMQLRQLIDGDIDRYRTERRYRRSDGTSFWGLVSASLVRARASRKPLDLIVQITDIDREKAAVAALAASESRWNFALDSAGQGVWDHDLSSGRVFYSARWKLMRGFAPEEDVDPSSWLDRVHPDDRERILERIRRQDSGELSDNEFEYRERHQDGHWIWILSRGKPIEWKADGSVARILGTDTDITKLKDVEARLAAEKEFLAVTLDSIADGVIATDPSHAVILMNPAAEELTGWRFSEAAGRRLNLVCTIVDERSGASAIDPVLASLGGKADRLLREGLHLVTANGRTRVVRECASVVRKPDGIVAGGVLVIQDITESHAIKQDLSYSATHDPLTALFNRSAFDAALDAALAEVRGGDRRHALCFIDLDRFKHVNDSAGHAAGDALLKRVAQAIEASCRSQDMCARLGGDEFALILRDCSLPNARSLAEKTVQAIKNLNFDWSGKTYRVGASVGVVPIDYRSVSTARLLEQADAACYAEKRTR
ncbi:MAG: PAS domain S-box protein [Bauldia sp.]|nr:PAS domain S-box protein [Bauldia sp.]